MSLGFNCSTLIYLNDMDVEFNVEQQESVALPKTTVDLAVKGIGNFAIGNYTQKSSDVEDIVSNFSLNSTLLPAVDFHLIDIIPDGISLSTYGTAVHTTKDKLVVQGRQYLNRGVDDKIDTGSSATAWFANLEAWSGSLANVADIDSLIQGKGGLGPVLVQAASAALFKSFGKHGAFTNDEDIADKATTLASTMSTQFIDSGANYVDSVIFKQYLHSGRYADDVVDVNNVVSYNLDNTTYDFIVEINGSVLDKDSDSFLDVGAVLGNGTLGTDHLYNSSSSKYQINVFMRLEQQDDV